MRRISSWPSKLKLSSSRCLYYAPLFALLLTVLFGASSVNAASVYDDAIQLTDELYLTRDHLGCNDPVYITTTWGGIMADQYEDWPDLQNAIATGSYGVTLRNIGTNYYVVYIFWSETQNLKITFEDSGFYSSSVISAETGDFNLSVIELNTNCEPEYSYTSTLTDPYIFTSGPASGYDMYAFIAAGIDVQYPIDYEGEIIPDTAPQPPLDLVPDIFMHNVINYKGEFSDKNYLTTDEVPVLCSPDNLAPAISITLFAGTSALGTPLDTINASASSLFYIDFKQYDPEYGYFTIVASYTCGEDSEPTFSDYSEYTFEIDEHGYLVNEGFTNCITNTFPFVDFGACVDNIGYLMNSLSFNTITFAEVWRIEDNGCRTLGTIGDWMGLEGNNRVVCPAFPEGVRNVVTPFVTFMLGIVTLGVLLTKSSREIT